MDTPLSATYEIELRGGPLDGRILPGITGDPTTPPDTVRHPGGLDARVAIYSPRPAAGDDGPLWVYVFIGYELDA
ncbi:hypothetical protein [Streptomyces luteocolor]|uniref:hypothetical protein n=1 Tax=Streptomyces luteocolor TaxID=285500 RepID=UPI000852B7F5|nr:hypothetical protein [Streptomyces luteocolor]